MMKSLLLLGAVFFGAEAESQEIQKLLAYARQLNQTLGSLTSHATKTRRLQSLTLAPMPAGCPAACDGIQCAYDDSQAIINQINGAGSDTGVALSAAGDLLGSVCLHRTAMTCASSSTECGNVVAASDLALAPCFCDACPNFPKIYEGMGPLISTLSQASGGSLTSEQMLDSLLTALCPMSSTLECLSSNSACTTALASMGDAGTTLSDLTTMQSQCAAAGKPTSYATIYSFTSPTCPAHDISGADGLLQLNLLAGSLLSILS